MDADRMTLDEARSITTSAADHSNGNLTINGVEVKYVIYHHPRMYPGVTSNDTDNTAYAKAISYVVKAYDRYYSWVDSRIDETLCEEHSCTVRAWMDDMIPSPTMNTRMNHLHILIVDDNDNIYAILVARYNHLQGYYIDILHAYDDNGDHLIYDYGEPVASHLSRIICNMGLKKPVYMDLIVGIHSDIETLFTRYGYLPIKAVRILTYDECDRIVVPKTVNGVIGKALLDSYYEVVCEKDRDMYYYHVKNSYPPALSRRILGVEALTSIFASTAYSFTGEYGNPYIAYASFKDFIYTWYKAIGSSERTVSVAHHLMKFNGTRGDKPMLVEFSTMGSNGNSVESLKKNKPFIITYRMEQALSLTPSGVSYRCKLYNKMLRKVPEQLPRWKALLVPNWRNRHNASPLLDIGELNDYIES